MEPAEGYSLTHAKSAVEDADWVSGDHRSEGVIVAARARRSTRAFRTAAALDRPGADDPGGVDAPASVRHTGRVLHEVVGADASVRAGESAPAPGAPPSEERSVTDTEADEMEEHLRGLGYLE